MKYSCQKIQNKSVTRFQKKFIYKPSDLGFSGVIGDGRSVSIAIIDTGVPSHKDLCNIQTGDNFSQSNTLQDKNGHATCVSGILNSNGGSLMGICPGSTVLYLKAINDNGLGDFANVQAAFLSAIINRVDIILMPFGSTIKSDLMQDVVYKAIDRNVHVIAADGRNKQNYPAGFDNVISVGGEQSHLRIDALSKFPTSYLNNTYTRVSGSSFESAVVAGVCALILQQNKAKGCTLSCKNMIDIICSRKK